MSRPQYDGADSVALLALRRMEATGTGSPAEVDAEDEEDDEEECPPSVSSVLGLLEDIVPKSLLVADLWKTAAPAAASAWRTAAAAAASAWRAPAAVEEPEVSLGEFIAVRFVVTWWKWYMKL